MLFLLISCYFNSFFTIPVKIENARRKLALTIPTGALITVANDAIEILSVVTNKTINDLTNSQKSNIFSKPFAH